jgi:4-hydroxy-tetrahydrodipicolinate synthase
MTTITSSLPKVLSPVLTPFTNTGEPDSKELFNQCVWLQENGVGQAILGTNSEANSMSSRQKIGLLNSLIAAGLNPDGMMPGTGACSVDEAYQLTKAAFDAGCKSVLMLPPFFYKDVSDDGLFAYYSKIIEKMGEANLHIYIYNIPPVTKVGFSLPLLERLVKSYPKTIVGMKDSSGDWGYTKSVIDLFSPGGFRVYAGSEIFLLDTMRAGGFGCISATANVNPKAISQLAECWSNEDADEQQAKLCHVRSLFAKYPMIPGMKAAVAHFSGNSDWLRVQPPLITLSESQKEQLIKDLAENNFVMSGLK